MASHDELHEVLIQHHVAFDGSPLFALMVFGDDVVAFVVTGNDPWASMHEGVNRAVRAYGLQLRAAGASKKTLLKVCQERVIVQGVLTYMPGAAQMAYMAFIAEAEMRSQEGN